uniref:Protein disulfide-isomerase n=1 Tax=Echeneis naucrates TaxID=173247 RepID=A0A665W7B2_ECHNA
MRTHTLLSITLLGLLLWASCVQASDSDQNQEETSKESTEEVSEEMSEETEEAPKEKTTEIEEEKDVMVLHINNFDRALSENQYLLVEFYAPWCGHCKQLEPQYAEAAGKLKAEELAIRLAKVDATEERELSDEFDVGGFPTLILFINGQRKQPITYTGKRSADGIIKWMKRRTGPGAEVLESTKSAAQFIDAHNITVVGFFDVEAAKVFKEVAFDVTDTEFGVTTTPEVFQKYEVKTNSVVLFKKFDDGRADFVLSEEEKLDKRNLTSFIQENSMELIIRFSKETVTQILTSPVLNHALLFVNKSSADISEIYSAFKSAAEAFRLKILFVLVNVDEPRNGRLMEYFRVRDFEAPLIRLVNLTDHVSYHLPSDTLDVDTIKTFCQSYLEGKAKVMQSEPIPEGWDKKPVKELVGMTLEKVTFNPDKTVFVLFYAPWCGHCKQLEPQYAEAAGKLKAEELAIRLAKVDATEERELSDEFDVGGFPTLILFINGQRKQPITYTGTHTLLHWCELYPPSPLAAKVFKEVAFDVTDTEFGVTTTPEVFQKYEVKTNSVVLFKKV